MANNVDRRRRSLTKKQHSTMQGAPSEITHVKDDNSLRVHDGKRVGGYGVLTELGVMARNLGISVDSIMYTDDTSKLPIDNVSHFFDADAEVLYEKPTGMPVPSYLDTIVGNSLRDTDNNLYTLTPVAISLIPYDDTDVATLNDLNGVRNSVGYNTVAEISALAEPTTYTKAVLNGVGGGEFEWIPSSTETVDGVLVVERTGHVGSGRWERVLGDVLLDTYWGTSPDATTLQALFDASGARNIPFVILQDTTISAPVYVNHHNLKGRTIAGKKIISNVVNGTAISFNPVTGNYPVNPELVLSLESTLANQVLVELRASYANNCFFNLDMNNAACTNCTGVVIYGDDGGTGSYYNRAVIRGQGGGQAGTTLVETRGVDEVGQPGRGPNASHYTIQRGGQFDVVLRDRTGSGNTFVFQAAEASSGAGAVVVHAGCPFVGGSVLNNNYHIQYAENMATLFQSDVGDLGGGLKLVTQYATGGESISDAADILSFQEGAHGQIYSATTAARRPRFRALAVDTYPIIENPASPALDFLSTNSGSFLRILSSVNSGIGSLAARFLVNGTEFFRAGTSSVSPATDGASTCGTAAQRWSTIFASNGTINTSDGRLKKNVEPIPDDWLDAWANVEWVRFQWKEGEGEAGWNVGVIAQSIEKAFKDAGLNALEIGVLRYDEWDTETDEEGNVLTQEGNRYSVNYNQASALESALLRRTVKDLKSKGGV